MIDTEEVKPDPPAFKADWGQPPKLECRVVVFGPRGPIGDQWRRECSANGYAVCEVCDGQAKKPDADGWCPRCDGYGTYKVGNDLF